MKLDEILLADMKMISEMVGMCYSVGGFDWKGMLDGIAGTCASIQLKMKSLK